MSKLSTVMHLQHLCLLSDEIGDRFSEDTIEIFLRQSFQSHADGKATLCA